MESWIAEAIGLMHINKITQKDLAKHLGYTEQYISMIFNGKKTPEGAKEKIMPAIKQLAESRCEGERESI